MRNRIAVLLVVLLTCLVCACSKPDSGVDATGAKPSAQRPIKVGAILILSGDSKSYGETQRAAFEIAAEDARQQGRPVPELLIGDSKLDKDTAQEEFRRLVSEGVVAFVEVGGSGMALAVAKEATRLGIPIMSAMNTSPALTPLDLTGGQGGEKTFFRVIPSDARSAEDLVEWALGKNFKHAAIIYNSQNDWADGFQKIVTDTYRTHGGTIDEQDKVRVTDQTVDFGAAITALKQRKPQVIFLGMMGRQAGLFASQAVDKGLEGPFLGVDNMGQQEFVDNATPDARPKTRFVLPAETNSEASQKFASKFRQKTGRDADGIAFKTYDAYMVVLSAIESLLKKGQEVSGRALVGELKSARLDGLTGLIEFNANHDLATADYVRLTYSTQGEKQVVQ